jgi:hypothetical protein
VSATVDTNATTEELLGVVFSVGSMQMLYEESLQADRSVAHVEAGSNASAAALQVAGGDEKETQCLSV